MSKITEEDGAILVKLSNDAGAIPVKGLGGGEGGLTEVHHDATLSGKGTESDPLKVVGGGGDVPEDIECNNVTINESLSLATDSRIYVNDTDHYIDVYDNEFDFVGDDYETRFGSTYLSISDPDGKEAYFSPENIYLFGDGNTDITPGKIETSEIVVEKINDMPGADGKTYVLKCVNGELQWDEKAGGSTEHPDTSEWSGDIQYDVNKDNLYDFGEINSSVTSLQLDYWSSGIGIEGFAAQFSLADDTTFTRLTVLMDGNPCKYSNIPETWESGKTYQITMVNGCVAVGVFEEVSE